MCLVAVSLFAAAPDIKATLDPVERRYNSAGTLEVAFEEKYQAPGRPTKVEKGTLLLRKPGQMRWNYTDPAGKVFLSDGKFFWLYTPDSNRVEKIKMKESDDMRAPLAFLLGKLDFDKEFQKIEARSQGDDILLVAYPKSSNLPYTRVEFVVTPDHRIQRVQVTGYDQSVLEFIFQSEKVNPRLSAQIFRFEVPAGAELVEATQ